MNTNYNNLARYLIDIKIEGRLHEFIEEKTKDFWESYRTIITENWLNPKNSLSGISKAEILKKIEAAKRRINNKNLPISDVKRNNQRFLSSEKLKSGNYSFSELKIFLDFSDPLELISILAKKDFRKRFRVRNNNKAQSALSYIKGKRVDQYHPESSDIHRESPFTVEDIRNILDAGIELFDNIGLSSESNVFDFYTRDITELVNVYEESNHFDRKKDVSSNLPKREHQNWGYTGYEKQLQKIITKIYQGNNRFFQVIGQGGSGKSALVNEFCHEILLNRNKDLYFKQFIWISSKSDVLTNSVIQPIRDGRIYRGYDDFIRQLFLAINGDDVQFQDVFEDIELKIIEKEVKHSISGKDRIKRLIVIDNFENISEADQQKIVSFLDDHVIVPNFVIITSRHKILENYPSTDIELHGLNEENAIKLFDNLITYHEFNEKLTSRFNENQVKEFVKKANFYPLAIKYFIEKAKKEDVSLKSSFNNCHTGNSELHEFIFRDTFNELTRFEKRLLRTIVIYRSELNEDVDKNVLKVIHKRIYSDEGFNKSLNSLKEKTLVSFIGFQNDDVNVTLSDLVASHVDFLIKQHEIDIQKTIRVIEDYNSKHRMIVEPRVRSNIRTSYIQESIFKNVLSKTNVQFSLEKAIGEIAEYSESFYGLDYLKAKLFELQPNAKKDNVRIKICGHYESAIRKKPEYVLFWVDYIDFIEKYYKKTISNKLKHRLDQLYEICVQSKIEENKKRLLKLVLKCAHYTNQYKSESFVRFMEFAIQDNICEDISYKYLPGIKYAVTHWLERPNKESFIQAILDMKYVDKNDDNTTSLILKDNLDLFRKMKNYLKDNEVFS